MSIASLDDLTQKVGQWLFGRTDLAPLVPDFVTLFEAKANRTLFVRQMEQRVVATLDGTSDTIALPPGFQTMRAVRLLNLGNGEPGRLTFRTNVQFEDEQDRLLDRTGLPKFFTLYADEMQVVPFPADSYQVQMIYRQDVPGLGTADPLTGDPVTTNWLLQKAPDAYLYGALMEAAPYLMDDDRISVWANGVNAAFQQLNDLSEEALYNAGPLVMRSRRRAY